MGGGLELEVGLPSRPDRDLWNCRGLREPTMCPGDSWPLGTGMLEPREREHATGEPVRISGVCADGKLPMLKFERRELVEKELPLPLRWCRRCVDRTMGSGVHACRLRLLRREDTTDARDDPSRSGVWAGTLHSEGVESQAGDRAPRSIPSNSYIFSGIISGGNSSCSSKRSLCVRKPSASCW